MTCDETQRFLRDAKNRGAEPLPKDVVMHLLTCERCRERNNFTDLDLAEWEPSARVRWQIRDNIARFLIPVEPLPPRSTIVLRTVAVLVVLPAVVLGLLGDGGLHVMSMLQLVGVIGVILAADLMLSFSLAGLMAPATRRRVPPVLLVVACLAAFLAAILLLFPRRSVENAAQHGIRCLVIGCAVAIPAAFALWLITRRGVILFAGRMGAVIGLLTGLAGASVLVFYCNVAEVVHLAVWHTNVLLICTLVGAALGTLIAQKARSSI